jgi:hypothetical protein
MFLKNSITELENIYNSNYNKKNEKKSILVINNIFDQITLKDDINYNIFLDELKKNFIFYFASIFKTKINDHNLEKNELHTNKYFVNEIEKNLVEEIKKILSKELNNLINKEKNNLISRSDLTCSGGLKIRRVINLLNNYLSKNGHLDLVSNYLGYKSNINGLALELSSSKSNWWKHKKDNSQPKTLAVHLDKEFTCVKSILYLSDVKLNNGPFTVYPKIYENLKLNIFQDILGRIILETATNTKNEKLKKYLDIKENSQPFLSENLQKIYSKLPEIVSFNSHFGWELKSGSELEKEIINNRNIIFGNSGTMITFDGSRLLHSGGLVKEESRLALQIIYSKETNIISRYFKKIKNKIIK